MPSSVRRLRKLEIVVSLLLLLLSLCIMENVVRVRAIQPNQNANHVSNSIYVDLAYLAGHLADFENLTVTTKGTVRTDFVSFYTFVDFWLQAQNGATIMVVTRHSGLSIPSNGSFVEISGIIQFFIDIEAGAYFLNATSLRITSTALTLEHIKTWYWTGDTNINSVARADVNGDDKTEIVTGGGYYDGNRFVAQLCVWNGSSLALERLQTWYWTGNTSVNALSLGDVDWDGHVEIVTGGYYNDGLRDVAQLCVWDGSSLALENVKVWFWFGNTVINSVALGDVDADLGAEIVTGGYYFDGVRYVAQLVEWNGVNLAVDRLTGWYWNSNAVINSVAIGDVDGDRQTEVVTGGYYNDGTRTNAQLIIWSGSSLSVENIKTWYWTGNAVINSVAIGDINSDFLNEIVAGGAFYDGTRLNSQLTVWGVI